MTDQTATETKTKKSRHKALCVKAGKLAGSLVRQVYPLGTSAYEVAQQAVKKGEAVVDTICFCRRGGRKRGIKSYEKKQQQFFTQLGAEIFFLKAKGTKDIFDQSRVKELMAEAQKIEDEIQAIKDAIEAERLDREAQLKFNRAVVDLKHDDSEVRLDAIRILEESDKKEAISHLTGLLEDPDEVIQVRVAEAIKKLTGSEPATAEKAEVKSEPEVKRELETKTEPKPKTKAKSRARPRLNSKVKLKPEIKPAPEPDVKPELEIKSEPESEPRHEPDRLTEPTPPVTRKKLRRKRSPKKKAMPFLPKEKLVSESEAESSREPESESKTEPESEPESSED